MKSSAINWVLSILGTALTLAGLLLPIWSKNGIGISGFEGAYLSFGRWVLLAASTMALLGAFVAPLRTWKWTGFAGLVLFIQSGLILWKGYKLGAVGIGGWVLLLAAALVLTNAFFLHRGARK